MDSTSIVCRENLEDKNMEEGVNLEAGDEAMEGKKNVDEDKEIIERYECEIKDDVAKEDARSRDIRARMASQPEVQAAGSSQPEVQAAGSSQAPDFISLTQPFQMTE